MKISKKIKKVLSVVLTLALIVTSVTISQVTSKADDETWTGNVKLTYVNGSNEVTIDWDSYNGESDDGVLYIGYVGEVAEGKQLHNGRANWTWGKESRHQWDNVSGTKDESVVFDFGQSYDIIMIAYDKASGEELARKTITVSIADIGEIGGDVVFKDLKVESDAENEAVLFASWNPVNGARGYITYIDEVSENNIAVAKNGYQFKNIANPAIDNVVKTIGGTTIKKDTEYTIIVNAIGPKGDVIGEGQIKVSTVPGADNNVPPMEGYTQVKASEGGTEIAISDNWSVWIAETQLFNYKLDDNGVSGYIQRNNDNWDAWATQYIYKKKGLEPNSIYDLTMTVKGSSTDFYAESEGNFYNSDKNQDTVTITSRLHTNENGELETHVGLGIAGIGVIVTLSDVKVTYVDKIPETTTPEPTTVAPTTKAPETQAPTKAPIQTTKATGNNGGTTTKVLDKTPVNGKLAATKVTKATKKKAATKVKLTFKKVNGAKKYQVQVSTSKKFKKVLVTKTVKKTTATIKNKKLKNKKKLYVRVKAVGAAKWSKVKKVKIK